jgi:hypothetical protein
MIVAPPGGAPLLVVEDDVDGFTASSLNLLGAHGRFPSTVLIQIGGAEDGNRNVVPAGARGQPLRYNVMHDVQVAIGGWNDASTPVVVGTIMRVRPSNFIMDNVHL